MKNNIVSYFFVGVVLFLSMTHFIHAADFSFQFGSTGSVDGQFDFPVGITLDASGNMYVADQNNNRIQKFDSSGNHLLSISSGTNPTDVAVDGSGNIYVAVNGASRINKYDSAGTFIGCISGGVAGFQNPCSVTTSGSGDAQFLFDAGIDVDSAGNIYVASQNNNRIQKFDSSGNFLGCIGGLVSGFQSPCLDFSSGSADGQFANPFGVEVDQDGNIYVGDRTNSRVQVFNSSGIFLRKFGTSGAGVGQFSDGPFMVDVGNDGSVYAVDRVGNKINVFSSSGVPLTQFGTSGSGAGQFTTPFGVSVDANNNVFVADTGNNRIQVFLPVFLEILSISPTSQALNAPKNSTITVVFDRSLNPATVTSSNFYVHGLQSGLLSGGLTVSTTNVSDDTIVFDPTHDFFSGEKIEVVLTTGIQSLQGSSLYRGKVLSFTTQYEAPVTSFTALPGFSTNSTTAGEGYGKTLGDFDGDGDLDLILVNGGVNAFESALTFSGNGDGTFNYVATYPYAFNTRPKKIHTADFNHDGNLDFVVNGLNIGDIEVFFGNGDLTFSRTIIANVSGPYAVNVDDYNGNGTIDIAWVPVSANAFQVVLNNGNGTFGSVNSYSTNTARSVSGAGIDFNNDQFIDVISPSFDAPSTNISLLLGNGNGTFSSAINILSPYAGGHLLLLAQDFNNDSNADFVVTSGGNAAIFLGDGSGGFSQNSSFSYTGFDGWNYEVADFDADGDFDLLFSASNDFKVFFNDGSGDFSTSQNYTYSGTDSKFAIGDVNNDGILDVVTTSGDQVIVLLETPVNAAPVATVPNNIGYAIDGSGHVLFQTTVSDADSDLTRLKVEYSDDGGVNYFDAELVSAVVDTGTMDLNNGAAYQVGSTDEIDTDSGMKTLSIVWDSQSASNGNGPVVGEQNDIRLRVTPNDFLIDGLPQATTDLTVDNLAPVGLTALVSGTTTSTTQELSWSAVTENNFHHYEIWYGEVQADVVNRNGAAVEWDNTDDLALGTISTVSTIITGLDPAKSYYFKIFAVDSVGNEETVLEIQLMTFSSGGRSRGTVAIMVDTVSDIVQLEEVHQSSDFGEIPSPTTLSFFDSLSSLYQWMDPVDYELTEYSQRHQRSAQEFFRMKQTLKFLATVAGYSDGYEFNKPEKEPIENAAELMKTLMISFSDCYTPSQLESALQHDQIENPYWMAGYWYFLSPLMEKFLGEEYRTWDTIANLNMLKVVDVFLKESCGQADL